MEADGVDADRAARRSILARLEGDALSTAALRILEDGTAFGAGVGLMTGGSVRHAVLAIDVGIVSGRDLHLIDGHPLVVIARHRWITVEGSSDALLLESTFAQEIAFAESTIAALEARELVGTIAVEGARLEVAPVITALL